MTFARFKANKNSLQISVSGIAQITQIVGPLKLGERNEENKVKQTSRECNKRREVSGAARFGYPVGVK